MLQLVPYSRPPKAPEMINGRDSTFDLQNSRLKGVGTMSSSAVVGATGSNEDDDDYLMVRAIVYNRNSLFKLAFQHLAQACKNLARRKACLNDQLKKASKISSRSALWRGYTALLRISPHAKRVKAQQWRCNHLRAVTFGAWVHFCTFSRLDREDFIKANVYWEKAFQTRALKRCMEFVDKRRSAESSQMLAQLFHRLVKSKQYLLRFKSRTRDFGVSYENACSLSARLITFLRCKHTMLVHRAFSTLRQASCRRTIMSKQIFQSPCYTILIQKAFKELLCLIEKRTDKSSRDCLTLRHLSRRKLSAGLGFLAKNAHSRKKRQDLLDTIFAVVSPRLNSARSYTLSAKVVLDAKCRCVVRSCRYNVINKHRQKLGLESKEAYFELRFVKLALLMWLSYARRTKSTKKLHAFQVLQHRSARKMKQYRSCWEHWLQSSRLCRSRKARAYESLEVHYLVDEFKRSRHSLISWNKCTRSAQHRREAFMAAELSWRRSRLSRVVYLLWSRSNQGKQLARSPRSRALWRSGLGAPCVLFFAQVNRSHRAVAISHSETRRLASYFSVWRERTERCGSGRCQVHAAIWFWKFWREAIAVKRWRTRVLQRRSRRDALRMAAVEYGVALGKTVLRRWIINAAGDFNVPVMVMGSQSSSDPVAFNLLQSCFLGWRSIVHPCGVGQASITDLTSGISPRKLPPATDIYSHNSAVKNRTPQSLSASPPCSSVERPRTATRDTISGSESRGVNLLTAKPRIPHYLLPLPSQSSGVQSCLDTSCGKPCALPPARQRVVETRPAFSELLTLEQAVAELARSDMCGGRNNSTGRVEKKKLLAEYMRQCAFEIERLKASGEAGYL